MSPDKQALVGNIGILINSLTTLTSLGKDALVSELEEKIPDLIKQL